MSKKQPPVPPANRSRKGTGSDPEPREEKGEERPENLKEQGQQGNIRQNTRNQGYQQDR
jgi:hypothetical protein